VESKCASFTNLKDEHEALPGYSGSVSPCAGSSMSAKNDANDSIGMQAEFLPPTLTPGNSKLYDSFHRSSFCLYVGSPYIGYALNSSATPAFVLTVYMYLNHA
jgi:hypothetical protein